MRIDTTRPDLLEALELPALAYAAEHNVDYVAAIKAVRATQ